jgi:hypothetical protein
MARTPSDVVVVRQNAAVFVVFFLIGVLFCVAPWFIDVPNIPGIGRLPARLFFAGLGCLAMAASVWGWKALRIGLAIDRQGIWCSGCSLRGKMTLLPWEAIVGARKVTWKSPEGTHDGILLGLEDGAALPRVDQRVWSTWRTELRRWLGAVEFDYPFLLTHDEWSWQPDELVPLICECAADPAARDRLGVYRARPFSPLTPD